MVNGTPASPLTHCQSSLQWVSCKARQVDMVPGQGPKWLCHSSKVEHGATQHSTHAEFAAGVQIRADVACTSHPPREAAALLLHCKAVVPYSCRGIVQQRKWSAKHEVLCSRGAKSGGGARPDGPRARMCVRRRPPATGRWRPGGEICGGGHKGHYRPGCAYRWRAAEVRQQIEGASAFGRAGPGLAGAPAQGKSAAAGARGAPAAPRRGRAPG